MLRLASLLALACMALADPVLWSQHEATATYDAVAVSRRGYVAAATWLNEPEVAEIFKLDHGDKVIKSTGDSVASDQAKYGISLSEDGTTAVAFKTEGGNFTSVLYKWNVATPSASPDWTLALDGTIVTHVDVSDDGATIAVAGAVNVSYFEPPSLQVALYEGETGKEIVEGRFNGKVGEQPMGVALSDNGTYCAFASLDGRDISVTVLHRAGGSHKHSLPDWQGKSTTGQSLAISGDGVYVAAGQATAVTVLKLKSTAPLAYEELFTYTDSSGNFYVGEDVISFAATGDVFAVGWLNIRESTGQPRVMAWHLPAPTPTLNYTWPVNPGAGQNIIADVAVSESGRFVAVALWGSEQPANATEQVQVLSIPKASEDAEGEIVFKYRTPGSMMNIGVTEATNRGLVVVAAGKHVHANVMGNGGDLFCLQATNDTESSNVHSMALVDQVNSAATTWKAALYAQFAGHSAADLEALMGTKLKYTEPMPKANHSTTASRVSVPASFDARTQWPGCVGKIRNQLQCGSCWAFAAAETLSDRVCIGTDSKTKVTLSPEYLLNCDSQDDGCGGGYLLYAWEYLSRPGLVSDECVPYTAGTGTTAPCNTKCTSSNATFKHFEAEASSVTELKTELAIQEEIVKSGPIQAAYSVFSDFMTYKSGVYTHTTGIFLGGHSIKIIGWGTQDSTPYWIVANSWGATWGMDGHFLIRRGVNECMIEANAIAGLYKKA